MNYRVSMKPQALSFYGVVEIAKEELEPVLDQHFQVRKNQIPKVGKKGFRAVAPSRKQAEDAFGLDGLYGEVWREEFIKGLRLKTQDDVCFVDQVQTADRGVHYELSGLFFHIPGCGWSPDFISLVKSGGSAWVRDQFVNDGAILNAIQAIRANYGTQVSTENASIQRGDRIRIEVDSDVNRGFGGKPQRALWELTPGLLPDNIIDALVGHQVGQLVIVPLPRPLDQPSKPARMTVKIVEHTRTSYLDIDEIAKREGLVNGAALRTRERSRIEAEWEKNRVNMLFHLIGQAARLGPIPAPFVFHLAEMRAAVQKKRLGDKEFSRAYGTNQDATLNMFLSQAKRESDELFLSYRLCCELGWIPTVEEVDHYAECQDLQDQDSRLYAPLILAKERIMEKLAGIEPPARSTLVLPESGRIQRSTPGLTLVH
jgi:hypothetical protein